MRLCCCRDSDLRQQSRQFAATTESYRRFIELPCCAVRRDYDIMIIIAAFPRAERLRHVRKLFQYNLYGGIYGKNEDINKILDILEETYPQAECALDHKDVYQLRFQWCFRLRLPIRL
ncbi:MAG: hypothetical protein ACLTK0_04775 [Anaerovoracaceae bacterium]